MRPRGEDVTRRFKLKAISVFISKELDNGGDFVLVKSERYLQTKRDVFNIDRGFF